MVFSFSSSNSDSTEFPKSKLIPLIIKLGDYLKKGFDHYVQMSVAGTTMDADTLSAFIFIQMGNWNPKVGVKEVLDSETKHAAARFLAGVAINLAKKGDQ